MATEQKICQGCGIEFPALCSEIKKGKAKYCSNDCRLAMLNGRPWNPDGINTGNPLQRTSCPISLAMLDMRYWKNGESAREIGSTIGYKHDTVISWLKKAGITIRSRSEERRLVHKKFPVLKDIHSQTIKRNKQQGMCVNGNPSIFHHAPKGRRTYIKKCKQRRVIVKCSWHGCSKMISRIPSEVKERMYCGPSCAMKHYRQLQRETKAQACLIAAHEAEKRHLEEKFGVKL